MSPSKIASMSNQFADSFSDTDTDSESDTDGGENVPQTVQVPPIESEHRAYMRKMSERSKLAPRNVTVNSIRFMAEMGRDFDSLPIEARKLAKEFLDADRVHSASLVHQHKSLPSPVPSSSPDSLEGDLTINDNQRPLGLAALASIPSPPSSPPDCQPKSKPRNRQAKSVATSGTATAVPSSGKGRNQVEVEELKALAASVGRFPLSLPGNNKGVVLSMQAKGLAAGTIKVKYNRSMQLQLLEDYNLIPRNVSHLDNMQLAEYLVQQRELLHGDEMQPEWTTERLRVYAASISAQTTNAQRKVGQSARTNQDEGHSATHADKILKPNEMMKSHELPNHDATVPKIPVDPLLEVLF